VRRVVSGVPTRTAHRLETKIAVADLSLRSYEQFEAEAKYMTADSTVAEIEAAGGVALGIEVDVLTIRRSRLWWARCRQRSRSPYGYIGQHPRSGAPTACDGDEPVRDRLFLQRGRADHEAAALREDHHESSVAWTAPSVDGGYAHYGAAKAAIAHYTRYLAQDLGPFGVTANCIAPGVIATGRIMATVIPGGIQSNRDRAELVALRRLGTVEDCAKVVEFLATDLSNYVTGAMIPIDGGLVRG
jgi:3-oxoacyl-[acyl-carrier protein] reductase